MRYLKAHILAWAMVAMSLGIGGCTSVSKQQVAQVDTDPWLAEIHQYKDQISPSDPDHISQILSISPEIRESVKSRFSSYIKTTAARRLANWLIDPDGHGMKYNVAANYSPTEAFERGEGNCLSFTILLSTLAKELGIRINYNEVDLPDIWDFDEDNGMVLYRHINGMYVSPQYRQVFDLAIENYSFGFPQRIITQESAVARFHSNRAMAQLAEGNSDLALHTIKLAISYAPTISDLWINLGVTYKRRGQPALAEKSYLRGYHLDNGNALAASNLERLYRAQGDNRKADIYEKASQRARLTNPYYHFNLAKQQYKKNLFRQARKSVRKAISLHRSDARFYELSSRIAQQQNRYPGALRDLKKAFALSVDEDDRNRYASKAIRVHQKAQEIELERQKARGTLSTYRVLGGQ